MAEISAAAVKALREKTGLPMMDCKRALTEAQGDSEKAVELLRKAGMKTMEKRSGRETAFGRIGLYARLNPGGVGAMIELLCESAPVAGHEEFVQLAEDLAKQLALGPGAQTGEDLLAQKSPSTGQPLKDQFHDLTNRIREVFRVGRIVRIDGPCGGYVHHNGTTGVLLEVEGDNATLAKDICMHVAALRPAVLTKEDLDPALVAKEREILAEAARHEGKPEKIIEKMVEGRLRNFYAERCLVDQPFVKDDSKTVGQVAAEGKLKILRFVHWEIGKE